MRKTFLQCCGALLAAPVLVLLLVGTVAFAAGTTPRDTEQSNTSTSTKPPAPMITDRHGKDIGDSIIAEPGLAVNLYLSNAGSKMVVWMSDNEDIAYVKYSTGTVSPQAAGKTIIRAYVDEKEVDTLEVEVSGIAINDPDEPLTVNENGTATLTGKVKLYGQASSLGMRFSSRDTFVAQISGTQVQGKRTGTATVEVTANNGGYFNTFTVEVTPDPSTQLPLSGSINLAKTDTLPFYNTNGYNLYDDFSSQLGGKVEYITGLLVSSTAQGTLYYRYSSEAEPGAGVAQIENYYLTPKAGQRGIRDVTFVPKTSFVGGEVTISYTAITSDGGNYSCKITLEVEAGSGSSGDSADAITMNTKYNTAVKLDANDFNRVCKERTNASLSYVVFAQTPVRQGTLYTNYSGEGSYGTVVSTTAQYSLRNLDDIWFVPAPGYTGSVTIYYTARSTGTPGKSYTGQVIIKVDKTGSGAEIGGLSYEISQGGTIRFDDEDFNEYCRKVLNNDSYQTLSFLHFTALPDASQGTLYYDYRSSANPGTRVAAGTTYYYGTRTPRLDRLTFVASSDFVGTARIPFTAQTADGTTFSGNVEVNVRGGIGTGDIQYTCSPGRSVSLDDSHFNRLSRDLTGSSLDYIRFQSLPNSSEGTLYYNSNTTVQTNRSYYNGSSTPRIDNLSFRATNSFSRVDIPFVGYSTNGGSFNGVITVSSSGSSSSGSGDSIRYSTDSKSAAVFDRDDFDDLSQWITDRNISSVKFDIPSTSQGSLYQNYRSSSSTGTRITSSNTSISASNLGPVAFVPASGYTGTVYIDFKATAASSGGTFEGTVEIEVGRAAADVTVRYSTRTAPVNFRSSDFGQSSRTLSSIQFTALPSSSAGYLYYQYTSPTQYGRQASTGATYRASGSNLISDLSFVPRAGYSGTVSIPYTGTNSNGSTFEGEVFITVSPTYSSTYFSDMGGYTAAQLAAVDYLYDHNITRGLSQGQYGPQSYIRRGDFARMVYQAFEFAPTGTSNVFHDVSSGAYYAEAINTLYARGIVSGTGGGYFSPDTALTREDAICMVQRAMRAVGWSANDGSSSLLYGYSDGSSVSGYAQGAMSLAVQRGYLPTSGGRLNPTQPLTRVDMAEIIHRVLTY